MDSVFPWLKLLPQDRQRKFYGELREAMDMAQAHTMPGVLVSPATYDDHVSAVVSRWQAEAHRRDVEDAETREFVGCMLRVFPWVKDLPREEWQELWEDVTGAVTRGTALGMTMQAIAQSVLTEIIAWQSTAIAHADGVSEIIEEGMGR